MKALAENWNDHLVHPYIRLCYKYRPPVPAFFQGPRRLLDYLIQFIEKGRYILTVEGVEYELNEGEIAVIQPGVLFTTHTFGECIVPNTHLDFFYNTSRAHSFVTSPGQTDLSPHAHLMQPRLNDFPDIHIPVKFVPENPDLFRSTLLQMIEHHKSVDLRDTIKLQQLAMDLLLQLLGTGKKALSENDAEQQLIQKMKAYLASNLSSPVSVKNMAKHAGYSESYFNMMFTKMLGMTPHAYLLNLRLERAKELLAYPTKFENIAEYCGFADAAHFSKAFKKKYGCSPREYRSRLQEQ
ncbi:AraC family transcriptional regulator [Paenibacillus thalictri]|uniref:AraC family transcriptional regulator n=1 Tax=Paenibacillus thalictri TaxID=2527873 RepID=UPI0013EF5624|nr:AraC family transcriptional regulator [Paenibacillus thalictri]